MIVKVEGYFREGQFSLYPGETWLVADLIEQRGFTQEIVDAHIGRGALVATADVPPTPSPVQEEHLQAVMVATGAPEQKTGLAEDGESAPMTEGKRASRAKE